MALLVILIVFGSGINTAQGGEDRPNILFVIAEDISYPHMSAYGTEWVNTPNFDGVAEQGILFENAYATNSRCAPSRASVLTGRYSWQLGSAAHHGGTFPKKYQVFPEVLHQQGYWVGYTGKGWGPGTPEGNRQLTGKAYHRSSDEAKNFKLFLEDRTNDKPFCFWYGPTEAHRGYEYGSGVEAGKQLAEVEVPPYWPDTDEVRNDMLDYAVEVEKFDRKLGQMLDVLKDQGELENTLVVVTTDHGMPFPRSKGHIFDLGVHVPMAIMWPDSIKNPGRTVTDYVSLVDIAPTFVSVAGIEWENTDMHSTPGTSLEDIFESSEEGRVISERDHVLFGREKQASGRPFGWGYPVRGIVQDGMFYVNNLKPNRWPAGRPETGYTADDGGPTKTAVLETRTEPKTHYMWERCFGKRPANMLYDMKQDPHNMNNLAVDPRYREKKHQLKTRLYDLLEEQRDPRMKGKGYVFQQHRLDWDPESGSYYEKYMNEKDDKKGWVRPSDYDPTHRPYWGEQEWDRTKE